MIEFSEYFCRGVNAFAAVLGFGVCLLALVLALLLVVAFIGFIVSDTKEKDEDGDGE